MNWNQDPGLGMRCLFMSAGVREERFLTESQKGSDVPVRRKLERSDEPPLSAVGTKSNGRLQNR